MKNYGMHPPAFEFQQLDEKLYVIMMYSNVCRYHSRARLFIDAMDRIAHTPGVELFVVEVAFGSRNFEVTQRGNRNHLRLRTNDELWHKENALNLLVSRLPEDWKYVAWVDGDVSFDSHPLTWAYETLHQLQHHHIVQLFDTALDLDINGNVMHMHKGFISSWKAGNKYTRQYGGWHPGYGWGYTRSAWNGIGGLIDFGILGSGDDHMAKLLIGKPVKDTIPNGLHRNYTNMLDVWQQRAIANIKYDIGFVKTTIKHAYHGPKVDRKYWQRWDYLKDTVPGTNEKREPFDPMSDIKYDWQGLWQLTDAKLYIRDGIREYFRIRNEDANN